MRVGRPALQRTWIFLTVALLSFLVMLFFFLDQKAGRKIDAARGLIEEAKTEALLSLLSRGHADGTGLYAGAFAKLVASEDFSAVVAAYTYKAGSDFLVAPSEASGPRDLLAIDDFLRTIAADQRKSAEALRYLLFCTVCFFIVLFIKTEFSGRKKLLEAEFRGKYEREALEALEHERDVLAYELHDTILQKLGFIKQSLEDSHGQCPNRTQLDALTGNAIAELRLLYRNLMRIESEESLSDQVKTLFTDFRVNSPISLESSVFGIEESAIDASMRHHIVRIIQELLTNGQKHSGAETIQLHAFYIPPVVRIVYRDNGPKPLGELPLTLKSIEFRCRILRASIVRNVDERTGLSLKIEVPIEDNSGR